MKQIVDIENEQNKLRQEIDTLKQILKLKKKQYKLLEEEKSYYSGFSYNKNTSVLQDKDDTKEELTFYQLLKEKIVEIEYEKTNGDIVIRNITLNPDFMDFEHKEKFLEHSDHSDFDVDFLNISSPFYAYDVDSRTLKKFFGINILDFEEKKDNE